MRNPKCVDLAFRIQRATRAKRFPAQDAQVFFEAGDPVRFAIAGGRTMVGTVEKLNPKTCTVSEASGDQWAAHYLQLHHLDPSVIDGRGPRADKLIEVATRARNMMDDHGLGTWSLCFNAGRQHLGKCIYRNETLSLSRHHAINGESGQVNDTILHEIAHALACPRAGHGPIWKDIARQIGATPSARADDETVSGQQHIAAKSRFRLGDDVSFMVRGKYFGGKIVRMNPKRAKVSCGCRVWMVPYALLEPA